MTPSLGGLKTEGTIGSFEFSEPEKCFEFQRLITSASPCCGSDKITETKMFRFGSINPEIELSSNRTLG
jgi:hypothetical protein